MIRRTAIIILIFTALISSQAFVSASTVPVIPSGTDLLDKVSTSLSASLDRIDSNITETAAAFGAGSLKNASIETIVTPYKMNIPGWAGVVLMAGDKNLTALNE